MKVSELKALIESLEDDREVYISVNHTKVGPVTGMLTRVDKVGETMVVLSDPDIYGGLQELKAEVERRLGERG